MEKKRIGFIRDSANVFGGAERVVTNLCNELCPYYHIYMINLYKNQDAYTLKADIERIYIHEKKRRLRYVLLSSVLRLREVIKQKHIDILVCVGMTAVLESYLASRGLSVKIVFYEQSTLNKYRYDIRTKKQTLYNKVIQSLINSYFDYILTLTEKEKRHYEDLYGIPSSHIGVIPNLLESKLENVPYQYAENSQSIITVGRIANEKGYELLVQVAAMVFTRHPDWNWHIYGNGKPAYEENIQRKIDMAGLHNKLKLMGVSANVYTCYPKYAMEILTSKYEGFSMVLLEGKAFWLPEVAFDIYSGPSDLIQDGVNGYLVKPFDVEAMADKICYLIEHPEVRRQFSKHARDNMNRFLKDNVIRQWQELFNHLTGC